MHGGVKVYRGAPSAARSYVEADRSRVDDYYLAEGSGLARRFTASPTEGVRDLGSLDGDGYERWVAGYDPDTGAPRGRLRQDAQRGAVRRGHGQRTEDMVAGRGPAPGGRGGVRRGAGPRRGPDHRLGRRARHHPGRTTRPAGAGPGRAESRRSRCGTTPPVPATRTATSTCRSTPGSSPPGSGVACTRSGFRDSIEAINGIGHAAVMTDPDFRGALAAHGFTLDPATGEVAELAPFVGAFSERAAQIARNIDRYEAEWRTRESRPGTRTGGAARLGPAGLETGPPGQGRPPRRSGDGRALDRTAPGAGLPRPHPTARAPHRGRCPAGRPTWTATRSWRASCPGWAPDGRRGTPPTSAARSRRRSPRPASSLDPAVRTELAEDLTARTRRSCVPLLDQAGVPEHVRSLTSAHVLEVEADIVTAARRPHPTPLRSRRCCPPTMQPGSTMPNGAVVAALAGAAGLVVVEGAAGAGKTTTLAATQQVLAEQGRRMLVVTPTLKAAQVAAREVGAAGSAAWLVHQHGYRWDADGRWTRVPAHPSTRRDARCRGSAAGRRGRNARPGHRTRAAERRRRDRRPGRAGRGPPPAPRGRPRRRARPRRPLDPTRRTRRARRRPPVHRPHRTPPSASHCAPAPPPTPTQPIWASVSGSVRSGTHWSPGGRSASTPARPNAPTPSPGSPPTTSPPKAGRLRCW